MQDVVTILLAMQRSGLSVEELKHFIMSAMTAKKKKMVEKKIVQKTQKKIRFSAPIFPFMDEECSCDLCSQ